MSSKCQRRTLPAGAESGEGKALLEHGGTLELSLEPAERRARGGVGVNRGLREPWSRAGPQSSELGREQDTEVLLGPGHLGAGPWLGSCWDC